MTNTPSNSENIDNDGLNENSEDTSVSKRDGDITEPGISEDEKKMKILMKMQALKGGK